MSLTKNDYMELLNGKNRGKQYLDSTYYVVKTKKDKPSHEETLLKGSVGLPTNLNPDYTNDGRSKNKKRKKVGVNQNLLRIINQR